VTGALPGDGPRLNPDAAHPPFPWRVQLPDQWAVLDTNPATWQRNLQRLVDERLAGQRLPAASRRELLGHLEDLVVSAQHGGVLLSLVYIGTLSSGTAASAGLHLAWYDSAPERASLSTARLAAGRQGVIDEVETDAGTIVVQRDHVMTAPPGSTTRHGLTSLQAFLPLTDRTWTALVATASAYPEITDMLRELVVAVAGSIHPIEDGPTEGPAPDESHVATAEYTPVEPPRASGVDRGFGTMIVRRIDPHDSRS
jgi:hypothetical protein